MWPIGTGILNKLNSPVTTLKTLLLKLGSTTPNSLWTGYLPGIISAIQSGKIKPTILLTSIISNQSSGIFLNPTLGFDKRINLFNVSEGLGSHLPEPCSEQFGPLDTIVPAGNNKISTSLKEPCSFFWTSSNVSIDFCIPSNVLGGKILAYSILLAILRTSFAKVDATSSLSLAAFLNALTSSLISFITDLYWKLWFLNLKNWSLITFNSWAAASNFNPLSVFGIVGTSTVFSTAVPEAPQPPSAWASCNLLFLCSAVSYG